MYTRGPIMSLVLSSGHSVVQTNAQMLRATERLFATPGSLEQTGLIIKLKPFSNHLKLFLNSVGRVSSKENSFQVKLTGYFIKMNHFKS